MWWSMAPAAYSKEAAYAVHCNWNKGNKKGRLMRDLLWWLDEADQRCVPQFDPLENGCRQWCVPIMYCKADARRGEPGCEYIACDAMRSKRAPPWHEMAFGGCTNEAESTALNVSSGRPRHAAHHAHWIQRHRLGRHGGAAEVARGRRAAERNDGRRLL
mmetsp:Transcript_28055/g.93255  ORF Transcript_28055/g.93255 Transcript_28055/m.93255 type:complete len:159 (-) Transcript_28055:40-516(-)